jgi:ATP-dependent Lhr-like helicase
MIRRRSLARLRKEVEPVEPAALGRLAVRWHGVSSPRPSPHALLDVVEQLQGAPLPASMVESEILPARLAGYSRADLDAVLAAGEVVWVGLEPIGDRDGRLALYLADHVARLLPPMPPRAPAAARERAILEHLRAHGASFFSGLHDAAGGGYPGETVRALWDLAWQGAVTNDTWQALRAFLGSRPEGRRERRREEAPPRSLRLAPPTAEGRWSLVRPVSSADAKSRTTWAAAAAAQLAARHGVVTREALSLESVPGGFGALYPVLSAMEQSGRLRRGYFVAGLGAAQFALPGALDLLRSLRDAPPDGTEADTVLLAATDPANPYGGTLKWPSQGPMRTAGAMVVLVDGALAAYLARGARQLTTWLPDGEPGRSRTARAIARALMARAREGGNEPRGMLIEDIDGGAPAAHAMAPFLAEAGFAAGAMGFHVRVQREGLAAGVADADQGRLTSSAPSDFR